MTELLTAIGRLNDVAAVLNDTRLAAAIPAEHRQHLADLAWSVGYLAAAVTPDIESESLDAASAFARTEDGDK